MLRLKSWFHYRKFNFPDLLNYVQVWWDSSDETNQFRSIHMKYLGSVQNKPSAYFEESKGVPKFGSNDYHIFPVS